MKIVDLPTFLAMPEGALYAKYEPCSFGELAIKSDTVASVTWYYQDLLPWFEGASDSDAYFDILDAIENGEPSPPLDFDTTTKDGLYETGQRFAVFERRDVEALIARLRRALADGYTINPDSNA